MGANSVDSFAAGVEPARRYRFLPYFFALELHRCHDSRRLIGDWLRRESLNETWLNLLVSLPRAHRPGLIRWLDRSGEIGQPIPAGFEALLHEAVVHHSPAFVAANAGGIIQALRKDCPAPFIAAWLELRLVPGSRVPLDAPAAGLFFPYRQLHSLGLTRGSTLDHAFRICGRGPEAYRFFCRPEWEALTAEERAVVIHFASDSESESMAVAFLAALAAMPPTPRAHFLAKGYSELRWALGAFGAARIPAMLRQWDATESASFELILWAEYFPDSFHDAVLGLPTATVKRLAKASHSYAAARRLEGGGYAIAACAARAFSWLAAAPAHFIDTCVSLAGCGHGRARNILNQAAAAPLFQPLAAGDGSADWLVRFDCLLQSHAPLARRLPDFATWEKHFSGVKPLKPASIRDVAQRLAEQLPRLQMWWLQEAIKTALTRYADEHTELFRSTLRKNRRPLNRFLRQFAAGRDVRLEHGVNRQWLARHGQGFNLEGWFEPPVAIENEITFGVERDPLEILKLGSYVGSCLAAGGDNAHAAVAILLDVNKRVVFARGAGGRFVARQVVGISDDAKLVCYPVYPKTTNTAIEASFERYVTAWAAHLGLPLAKGAEDQASERVRPLTVDSWYDDGLWGRFFTTS